MSFTYLHVQLPRRAKRDDGKKKIIKSEHTDAHTIQHAHPPPSANLRFALAVGEACRASRAGLRVVHSDVDAPEKDRDGGDRPESDAGRGRQTRAPRVAVRPRPRQ